jgi:hypothetical protein
MARPKKHNADYFSHDCDMRNDAKIKALRRKFGLVGYAVYNMLLEHLTNCDHFKFECTNLNIELLAGDFDMEPDLLLEIIDYLEQLTLISRESEFLFSDKLIERFEGLLRKRTQKPHKKGVCAAETPKKEVSDVENPQSKVKYSKVNNTSTNVDDINATDFDDLMINYKNLIGEDTSAMWREGIYRQYKLKNGTLFKLVDRFTDHLKTEKNGLYHKPFEEFRKHCGNWIRTLHQRDQLTEFTNKKRKGAL